jgi:hypothetical protein
MTSAAESPIPEPVRAIVELFDGPLAEVQFPQVDREVLAQQVIVVEQRRAELQQALAAVQAARTELDREQQTLLDRARQAHAYASVFAIDDTPLREQLAAIKLDSRPAAAPKKRGRKPKESKSQTSLPDRSGPALAVSARAAS